MKKFNSLIATLAVMATIFSLCFSNYTTVLALSNSRTSTSSIMTQGAFADENSTPPNDTSTSETTKSSLDTTSTSTASSAPSQAPEGGTPRSIDASVDLAIAMPGAAPLSGQSFTVTYQIAPSSSIIGETFIQNMVAYIKIPTNILVQLPNTSTEIYTIALDSTLSTPAEAVYKVVFPNPVDTTLVSINIQLLLAFKPGVNPTNFVNGGVTTANEFAPTMTVSGDNIVEATETNSPIKPLNNNNNTLTKAISHPDTTTGIPVNSQIEYFIEYAAPPLQGGLNTTNAEFIDTLPPDATYLGAQVPNGWTYTTIGTPVTQVKFTKTDNSGINAGNVVAFKVFVSFVDIPNGRPQTNTVTYTDTEFGTERPILETASVTKNTVSVNFGAATFEKWPDYYADRKQMKANYTIGDEIVYSMNQVKSPFEVSGSTKGYTEFTYVDDPEDQFSGESYYYFPDFFKFEKVIFNNPTTTSALNLSNPSGNFDPSRVMYNFYYKEVGSTSWRLGQSGSVGTTSFTVNRSSLAASGLSALDNVSCWKIVYRYGDSAEALPGDWKMPTIDYVGTVKDHQFIHDCHQGNVNQYPYGGREEYMELQNTSFWYYKYNEGGNIISSTPPNHESTQSKEDNHNISSTFISPARPFLESGFPWIEQNQSFYGEGEIIDYSITTLNSGGYGVGYKPENATAPFTHGEEYFFIPPYFDIISASAESPRGSYTLDTTDVANIQPTLHDMLPYGAPDGVLESYKVVKFSSKDNALGIGRLDIGEKAKFKIKLRVHESTAFTSYIYRHTMSPDHRDFTNDASFHFEDDYLGIDYHYYRYFNDYMDLNGNGDFGEATFRSEKKLEHPKDLALTASKSIATSEAGPYTPSNISYISLQPEDYFYYKINIKNEDSRGDSASKVRAIDILPYNNDILIQGTTNLNRNSDWELADFQVVDSTIPAGVNLWYTTTLPSKSAVQHDVQFTTQTEQVTTWQPYVIGTLLPPGVKAIKLEAVNVPANAGLEIKFKAKAPTIADTFDPNAPDVSWNSFAYGARFLRGAQELDLPLNEPAKTGAYINPRPSAFKLNGYAWEDIDGDGQQESGEPYLANVRVELYDSNNDNIGVINTDANGFYEFSDLVDGTYKVRMNNSLSTTTPPHKFTVKDTNQASISGNDFEAESLPLPPPPYGKATVTISGADAVHIDGGVTTNDPPSLTPMIDGYAWEDTNGNGIRDEYIDTNSNGSQDTNEFAKFLAAYVVELYTPDGVTLITSTPTDANGYYKFDNLTLSSYEVKITNREPAKYKFTMPLQGTNTNLDSNFTYQNASDLTAKVLVNMDTMSKPYIDAGFVPLSVNLSGYAWEDTNANGVRDDLKDINGDGTIGQLEFYFLPNVAVELYKANAPTTMVASTVTDSNGYYEFTNLLSTNYIVKMKNPNTGLYRYTLNGVGNNATINSDFIPDPSAAIDPLLIGKANVNSVTDPMSNVDAGFAPKNIPTPIVPPSPSTSTSTPSPAIITSSTPSSGIITSSTTSSGITTSSTTSPGITTSSTITPGTSSISPGGSTNSSNPNTGSTASNYMILIIIVLTASSSVLLFTKNNKKNKNR